MIGLPLLFAAALAGVSSEEPRVVGATPVTWPDARLGCDGPVPSSPSPVAGYRVNLQVGGQVYRVHVAGETATICGPPLGVATTALVYRMTRRSSVERRAARDAISRDAAARTEEH